MTPPPNSSAITCDKSGLFCWLNVGIDYHSNHRSENRWLGLNQKQKLPVGLFSIADPLVRPAHPAHDVSFVVDFDDVDQFSLTVYYVV